MCDCTLTFALSLVCYLDTNGYDSYCYYYDSQVLPNNTQFMNITLYDNLEV